MIFVVQGSLEVGRRGGFFGIAIRFPGTFFSNSPKVAKSMDRASTSERPLPAEHDARLSRSAAPWLIGFIFAVLAIRFSYRTGLVGPLAKQVLDLACTVLVIGGLLPIIRRSAFKTSGRWAAAFIVFFALIQIVQVIEEVPAWDFLPVLGDGSPIHNDVEAIFAVLAWVCFTLTMLYIVSGLETANAALKRNQEKLRAGKTALRESESRLSGVIGLAAEGIISIDEEQNIILFNASAQRIFGYAPEEAIGQPLEMLMPERYRELHRSYIERFASEDPPARRMDERAELVGLRKSGEEFPAEATISRLETRNGWVFTAHVTDITVQKRTEASLRQSEERYRDLVDRSPDVIWRMNREGVLTFVSPAIKAMSGFDPDEMAGLPFDEFRAKFLVGGSADEAKETLARRMGGDLGTKEIVYELTYYRKDGTQYIAELRSIPIVNRNGEIVEIHGLTRDITEHKEAEERRAVLEDRLRQSQKMEAIGTLAGGIAHDFNNILTGITGFAELAHADSPEGSPLRRDLEEILSASARAADLVQQILTFSHKSEESREMVELEDVISSSLKLLRRSIPSSIDILSNFHAQSSTIRADRTQIHQVLLNLCTNAASAIGTEPGVLELSLDDFDVDTHFAATHQPLKTGPHLRLTVRDSGCGMKPEIMDRVFEPYFTTREVGEGTGLGLALVHSIIEEHGGRIDVQSSPGEGTTFIIYLPCADYADQVAQRQERQALNGTERVLLVDDEEVIVRLLVRTLEKLGYDVVANNRPLEALEAFRAEPESFDLVITDQTMPKMTGDTLAKEILNIRPDQPIILCSGFSKKMGEEQALRMGIRRYLMKPVSAEVLSQAIRDVLDKG